MLSPTEKQKNEELLATLLPEVGELARRHLALSEEAGIDLLVVQAERTYSAQAALYATGRTRPGRIVTNAMPGYSWHNFGRAYDVAIVGEAGRLMWEGPRYRKVGQLGTGIGLVWGGDFSAIRGDLGHFEYHPGLTLAEARAAFKTNVKEDENGEELVRV